MVRRVLPPVLAVVLVLGCAGFASAEQIINFTFGAFTPRGEDGRVENDVVVANRSFLAFDLQDFNGAEVGTEVLTGIGDFFELGAGVSFYRRTVPSVYAGFVDRDGSEIEQSSRLRLVPLTLTVRVLPLTNRGAVQPYFGAGLAMINWRYSEFGEFVDFATPARELFRGRFVASGNAASPVVVAGVRFGGGTWTGGGEIKYTTADDDVGADFAAPRIDLGGWTYQATFGLRFR